MAKEIILAQEIVPVKAYETPKIDVMQIATADVICSSPEGGDSVPETGTTGNWGI